MENKIKIGWAEVDMTPDKPIKLSGQFYERISECIETPLTVTAMAIESGTESAVMCSCDLCSVSEALIEEVRNKLKGNSYGLDTDNIIVGATHTHTSYVYARPNKKNGINHSTALSVLEKYLGKTKDTAWPEGVMTAEEAFEVIASAIAKAVEEAWKKRDDAYYSAGFGRAAVGMCRRVVYNDGSAKMWGDTNHPDFVELEGGNDSGIEMLFTFDADKKPVGAIINVACPSQVNEQRSFISSDYWGKVKMYLREKFGEGFYVLGMCAAAGDQCPRDMIRWIEPETPIADPNVPKRKLVRKADPSMYDNGGTFKVAKRIVNEVMDAYEEAQKNLKNTALFVHKKETVYLPLRKVTIKEYDEAVKIIEDFARTSVKSDYHDNARLHIYAGTIARYEEQKSVTMVSYEMHTMRLDNLAFSTNPFELFLDYGNQIRARSYAEQTFISQLTQGSMSYLPTEKAEKGSHYSAYVSSGVTGHEGGYILVEKTLDSINSMFTEVNNND